LLRLKSNRNSRPSEEEVMFVQLITGRVTDEDGVRAQDERWQREVRPGAAGFLGSTVGLTGDGRFVASARFESADAAQRNSARPEQDKWWSEMQQYVTDVDFHDSSDVLLLAGGGSDDATFVQVMRGAISDREGLRELFGRVDEWEAFVHSARPDILGEILVLFDDDTFADLVYFTSEAEARAGEQKELSAEQQAMLDKWMRVLDIQEYLDLADPILVSADS
jgi:hypothetical protein